MFMGTNIIAWSVLAIVVLLALVSLIRSRRSEEIDNLEAHLDRYLGRKRVLPQMPSEKSIFEKNATRARERKFVNKSSGVKKSTPVVPSARSGAETLRTRSGIEQGLRAGVKAGTKAKGGKGSKAKWWWIVVLALFVFNLISD